VGGDQPVLHVRGAAVERETADKMPVGGGAVGVAVFFQIVGAEIFIHLPDPVFMAQAAYVINLVGATDVNQCQADGVQGVRQHGFALLVGGAAVAVHDAVQHQRKGFQCIIEQAALVQRPAQHVVGVQAQL